MLLEIRPIILLLSCIVVVVECKMEPFVVGGEIADITKFPHSVFLSVICVRDYTLKVTYFICGGSIINEMLVLTAAHCVYECSDSSQFGVSVGHINYNKGVKYRVHSFLIHERYDSLAVVNDIAIIKLIKKIQFSKKVKRIALMRNPPYYSKAQIAGWGWTDEQTKTMGMILNYVDQYVWKIEACRRVIDVPKKGALCASSGDSETYSSGGDSGSALVVRGYIQIGIVSYKMPKTSRSLVVYTDTGYFYNWITKNAKKLYCVN